MSQLTNKTKKNERLTRKVVHANYKRDAKARNLFSNTKFLKKPHSLSGEKILGIPCDLHARIMRDVMCNKIISHIALWNVISSLDAIKNALSDSPRRYVVTIVT